MKIMDLRRINLNLQKILMSMKNKKRKMMRMKMEKKKAMIGINQKRKKRSGILILMNLMFLRKGRKNPQEAKRVAKKMTLNLRMMSLMICLRMMSLMMMMTIFNKPTFKS